MVNTDLVLICDNILFDRKFYNPLFNNLSSIALVAPACKKRGIPIVHYNCSVGPIDFEVGKKALQRVMDASSLVITRDTQTKELFDKLGLNYPELHIHADCALNTQSPDASRLQEIIQKEGLLQNDKGTIGFNVNAYIDNWSMRGTLNSREFCETIGKAADRVIDGLDVDIIFFVTQVMDLKNTHACVASMQRKDRVRIISNVEYSYSEIAGLIQHVGVLAGLRTHTLIFAAAMNTPMVGVLSYPKSDGFLRTINQQDWVVPFEKFSVDHLGEIVQNAWQQREQTRTQLKPIVDAEKHKARSSAQLLRRFL
jgi:polysaccharide pyruvyl transferase WcaK-like protein